MVHLLGKPQGPPVSLVSKSSASCALSTLGVFFAAPLLSFTAAGSGSVCWVVVAAGPWGGY